ncbi:MAG: aspartate aminotransferase family protein [Lachnospiraceae bacterium]
MKKTEIIGQAEQVFVHTYNRYPIVLDHGEGVYLYDTDGKRYLDFAAGIAVMALGYGVKEYNDALKSQIDRLIHTSNYYYSEPAMTAGRKLAAASKMDRVFFTNSGTEAIEGAIKAAKKYAYTRHGHADFEIIAMEHSFHGRSIGALSVTGNEHYREAFLPLMDGVRFARLNDFESVLQSVSEKTCAIILEPIQGEGGIYPACPEFLRQVRALCDERDLVLIFDEIQCGMGRTGTMFAWQQYGVRPDVLAMAKAIGGGVPVGAFAVTERIAKQSLAPGDHGTTYGGNPFVCAAVSTVLDLFERMDVLANVSRVGDYLSEKLDELCASDGRIQERRGIGLMQGLQFECPVGEIIQDCQNRGLILINAGANVIRFVPPLVITEQHVDEMIEILKESLRQKS